MRLHHAFAHLLTAAIISGCVPSAGTTASDAAGPSQGLSAETSQTPIETVEADVETLQEPLHPELVNADTITIKRLQEHPDYIEGEAEIADNDVSEPGTEQELTEDAGAALPFPDEMKTCPRMVISNRPEEDENANIVVYHKIAVINTVPIALAPVAEGCFSSGFGPRGDHLHKGNDYYHTMATDIFAAGSGVVVEAMYRDDYGRMLLIDHSHGVFTRYAHLQSFAEDVAVGTKVMAGQIIGLMGNSAGYSIPRHLHYEVLVGNYDTPKKSFGLEPIDIFTH